MSGLQGKANIFWTWFVTISDALLQNTNDAYLISLLDNKISQLGPYDWEVGPYDNENTFLAISPNLNENYLELTRQIISLAPTCVGWVFLPSKPVKQWNGIFKMKNHLGKEILIDTNNWTYILYQFEDGLFEIDIAADEIDGNSDTFYLAVDIALTGYLGEEDYMRLITKAYIIEKFDDEATFLPNIKKHIESLSA